MFSGAVHCRNITVNYCNRCNKPFKGTNERFSSWEYFFPFSWTIFWHINTCIIITLFSKTVHENWILCDTCHKWLSYNLGLSNAYKLYFYHIYYYVYYNINVNIKNTLPFNAMCILITHILMHNEFKIYISETVPFHTTRRKKYSRVPCTQVAVLTESY